MTASRISEYSTGVAKGQTCAPQGQILTQRRYDAKPNTEDQENAGGLLWQCDALVMLNEVKHLAVYPCDSVEMFRFAQHDTASTAFLLMNS